MESTKRCPGCKQEYPATKKYFYKNKTKKDGLSYCCKQCQKQSHKQYYQAHKTEMRQYQKKYRKTISGHLNCVFVNMIHRCNNPKHKQYKNYGGRGIKVKFTSFDDFRDYIVNELKSDPRGLTIDRIDNDGNYERGNIRFITQAENSRNKNIVQPLFPNV